MQSIEIAAGETKKFSILRNSISIVLLAFATLLLSTVLSAPIQLSSSPVKSEKVVGMVSVAHFFVIFLFAGLAVRNFRNWVKSTGTIFVTGALVFLGIRCFWCIHDYAASSTVADILLRIAHEYTFAVTALAAIVGLILLWLSNKKVKLQPSSGNVSVFHAPENSSKQLYTVRRSLAALFDYAVFGAFVFASTLIFGSTSPATDSVGKSVTSTVTFGGVALPSVHSTSLSFFTYFWFWVFYFPLAEGITGRTLGKLLFGFRVVRERSDNPAIKVSFVRHLSDIVDFLPCGLVALVVSRFTANHKRIGDLLAGSQVLEA